MSEGTIFEMIDQVNQKVVQTPIPKDIDENLSAYLNDIVSEDLFGTNAIKDAEIILENGSVINSDENSDNEIIKYKSQEDAEYDPSILDDPDYVAPSPESSSHSVFSPPTSFNEGDNEFSDASAFRKKSNWCPNKGRDAKALESNISKELIVINVYTII